MTNLVTLEISVAASDFSLGRALDVDVERIELKQFVPLVATRVLYFWVTTADQLAFERNLRTDDRIESLSRQGTSDEGALYRIQLRTGVTQDEFFETLREFGLVVREAIGTRGEWRFRLLGTDRDMLSACQETLRERGISSSVDRIWQPDDLAESGYGLTDKQWMAVKLAYVNGYFEVPREANLTELSTELGISRQSFSRRLNRGLRNLLGTTLAPEFEGE